MRAWLLDALTGIGGLRLGEAPEPKPGSGEVVLDVKSAALNPADHYLAENQYPAKPPLPHILGRDGVGRVVAVGPGVEGIGEGDTRIVLRCEIGVDRPGTLAERVAVPAESLAEVPSGWTPEEAAAAPLVYLTAWQAICQWSEPEAPPPAGSVLLVTGASGGVGVASVQLGHAMGLRVLGLSRDPAKAERVRELGAEAVFDPNDPQWRKAVAAHLGDVRVDLAIDNIGGALLPEVIATVGQNGKVSAVGRLAGPVPQFNTSTLFFRRLRIGGVAVSDYTPAQAQSVWREVLTTLARTNARPVLDRIFGFDEVPAAFARLKQGPMGKVLVRVKD